MRINFPEKSFDVIILGGGPAGMSCAMWCADLGLAAVVVEQSPRLGGQLHRIYNPITNYLGAETADGEALFETFMPQVAQRDFCVSLGVGVKAVDVRNKTVTLVDGRSYSAAYLVIATGVSRRKLGVPGEEEFIGRGILESGMKARRSISGKTVVVVGGGDAAVENSLILANAGAAVTLVHRRPEFSCQGHFMEQAKAHPQIKILVGAVLEEIRGGAELSSIVLRSLGSGALEEISTDALLIRVGVMPNTTLMMETLKLDHLGYIVVDAGLETSEPKVYAIGDVCSPLAPTISTGVGQGAIVAKIISRAPAAS